MDIPANRTGASVAGVDKPFGKKRAPVRRLVSFEEAYYGLLDEDAHIELQDFSGVWRRVDTTKNNAQFILKRMQEIKRSYPLFRVRAVDSQGRLLDLLP
jgi:hypothetical protein